MMTLNAKTVRNINVAARNSPASDDTLNAIALLQASGDGSI